MMYKGDYERILWIGFAFPLRFGIVKQVCLCSHSLRRLPRRYAYNDVKIIVLFSDSYKFAFSIVGRFLLVEICCSNAVNPLRGFVSMVFMRFY
jgi:hypothetical protein